MAEPNHWNGQVKIFKGIRNSQVKRVKGPVKGPVEGIGHI